MLLWHDGKFEELINEGRAIQKRFKANRKKIKQKNFEQFVKKMEMGKVSEAIRNIGSSKRNVLEMTPEVLKELKQKHPEPRKALLGSVLQGPLPKIAVENVIFENLDAECIYRCAKQGKGAAGPSGVTLIFGKDCCVQSSLRASLLNYVVP